MAKLESSLKNMLLSLTIICVSSAAILAFLNEQTKERIAEVQKQKLENAIKQVVPEFDNSPLDEAYEFAFSETDITLIYPAKKENQLVAVAVESSSMNGFSGLIKILVGLKPDGTLLDYAVLSHAETPGLGDKMVYWFKTDAKNQNILGKNLSQKTLKLKNDGGDIDAITASTITSRAFLEAVNKAYSAYMENADSNSGATSDSTSGATGTSNSESTEDANSGATESH